MEPTIDQILAQIKAAHPAQGDRLETSLRTLEEAVRDQAAAMARCNKDAHEPRVRKIHESHRLPGTDEK